MSDNRTVSHLSLDITREGESSDPEVMANIIDDVRLMLPPGYSLTGYRISAHGCRPGEEELL